MLCQIKAAYLQRNRHCWSVSPTDFRANHAIRFLRRFCQWLQGLV